jgi:hypothetical protein
MRVAVKIHSLKKADYAFDKMARGTHDAKG